MAWHYEGHLGQELEKLGSLGYAGGTVTGRPGEGVTVHEVAHGLGIKNTLSGRSRVDTPPESDLLFYLARTDAWSENCRLLKLGRIRVKKNPKDFPDRSTRARVRKEACGRIRYIPTQHRFF